MDNPGSASENPEAPATQTSTDNAAIANLVRHVVQQIRPEILEAAKNAVSNVSSATKSEIEQWKELQEERRKRDNETFKFEGNQEQYGHANEILTEMENVDLYMQNKEWTKAKESLDKGKRIIHERIKLIKLADGSSWQTVKEFRNGGNRVEEADEKRWKAAQKVVREKAERTKRDSYYGEGRGSAYRRTTDAYRPYRYERPRPDSASLECWGCGKLGHLRSSCYRSRMNNY